jgi:hypothetical protein
MPAGDLPAEFHGPVAHSGLWLWLAVAGLLVVLLYYAAVTWWTRPPRQAAVAPAPAPPAPRADPRPAALAELDRIERAVATGRLSARTGHQQVSATVRGYVGAVSGLPADRMALADLRRSGAVPLADAVELMYPPSFAPSEEGRAAELFPEAARRARHLVVTWT